ncbi:hypothetical protein QBC44DRAFT_385662 [Cladorrhinum sp. PSN332]|nr:hypothetical protein QBC44DRAFT_385662 [Cladorrhinum sp. PSN332]
MWGTRLIPFTAFRAVGYIIHDGNRVNGTVNEIVTYDSTQRSLSGPLLFANDKRRYRLQNSKQSARMQDVARYVEEYGFDGLYEASNATKDLYNIYNLTNFGGRTVRGPVLNISAVYLDGDGGEGFLGSEPQANKRSFLSNIKFVSDKDTYLYSLDEITNSGRCQPVSDVYQWGFSFIQLHILALALVIWTVGIWIMRLRSRAQRPVSEYGKAPRGLRCLLHMASAVAKDLTEAGIEINQLSDDELNAHIRKGLNGGKISFLPAPTRTSKTGVWQMLKAWIKKSKWWLVSGLLHFVLWVWTMFATRLDTISWTNWLGFLMEWLSCLILLLLFVGDARERWLVVHFIVSAGVTTGAVFLSWMPALNPDFD